MRHLFLPAFQVQAASTKHPIRSYRHIINFAFNSSLKHYVTNSPLTFISIYKYQAFILWMAYLQNTLTCIIEHFCSFQSFVFRVIPVLNRRIFNQMEAKICSWCKTFVLCLKHLRLKISQLFTWSVAHPRKEGSVKIGNECVTFRDIAWANWKISSSVENL